MSFAMRIIVTIFCISGGLTIVFGVIAARTEHVGVEDVTSFLFDVFMIVFYVAAACFLVGLFWRE